MKRLILAAVAALALSACSVPKASVQADPALMAAGQAALRIALRRGVADYIERKGAALAPDRAARAKALVDDLLLVVNGDSAVTLAGLKELAYSKIPAEFSPLDVQDAHDVIDALAAVIEQQIGTGELRGDAIVFLRDVLSAVSAAAATFAPPS